MKYVVGTLYVLIALIIMLWAVLSEIGGIMSILKADSYEPAQAIAAYGKVLVFYPFMAYLAVKLARNGIKKFKNLPVVEANSNI